MSSSPYPEGPGSVSGAPNLLAGFTDTFTSQLLTGREDIFFGAEFDASARTNNLPGGAVRCYIETLAAGPDHLRGSFGFYRAIPTTIAQDEQRKTRRLTLPVAALTTFLAPYRDGTAAAHKTEHRAMITRSSTCTNPKGKGSWRER